MYLSRVHLKNIRCFKNLVIEFDLTGGQLPWTMILGDNASGKTTLLRSIAIGLCDETSASGLLREAEEGYIRRGEDTARISLRFKPSLKSRTTFAINTEIQKVKNGNYERLRHTRVTKELPWNRMFACAYGAGRGTSGAGDIAGYSTINAVYNLFNYGEGLQNPELTIRRLEQKRISGIIRVLEEILLRSKNKINLPKSGITIDGPWGKGMPLRDLADGYKSTFLWLTDFLGWALDFNPSLSKPEDIVGVILIDEIEQHLHPQWQRIIVNQLRSSFPLIQFITTTHSPLITASIGQIREEVDRDNLISLEIDASAGAVIKKNLDSMRGQRADQVLASEAFDYLIDSDPEVERIYKEGSILLAKGSKRSKKDKERLKLIKAMIRRLDQNIGTTKIEREIQKQEIRKLKKQWKSILDDLKDKNSD